MKVATEVSPQGKLRVVCELDHGDHPGWADLAKPGNSVVGLARGQGKPIGTKVEARWALSHVTRFEQSLRLLGPRPTPRA
jgi:hypothetical protein